MGWVVETLNFTVDAEVNALPVDMRAQLARISFLIQAFGLGRMREPHVKHLEGPLWEMRMRGRGRHFTGALCRRVRSARRYRSGLRKENPEDAAP